MDNLTRQLTSFASSLRFDAIRPDVIEKAKACLIDSLGCMYGGKDCESAVIWRKHLVTQSQMGHGNGRAIGIKGWMPADHAAFLNCAMIRYLDYNDSWHGGHPSDLLGGHLALAQPANIDGRRLLTAMIVSYEVMLRLIRAAKMGDRGFDQGFVLGIAAVCGLGNLLGLSDEKIANAIGMITVANVPMRATRSGKLSNWKGVATPYACRDAVFVTMLAADGLTGPDEPFEGRHALFQQITKPFVIEPFASDGGQWMMNLIRLKYWPAELHSQAGIWAALELRKRMAVDEIAHIHIETYNFCWFEIGSEPSKWDPKTRETADHSLPYIFSKALVDGKITVETYDEASFTDKSLRPLMNKISIDKNAELESLFPERMVMRVHVESKDGKREDIEMADPRGDARNPMTRNEVDQKFFSMADPVLGHSRAATASAAWWSIDQAAKLGPALDLLDF